MFNVSEFGSFLDNTQMNLSTVLVLGMGLVLMFLTCKWLLGVMQWVFSPLTYILKTFPLAYVTAFVLVVTGALSAGWGTGELLSGPPSPVREVGVDNSRLYELVKVMKDAQGAENLKVALDYAAKRDERTIQSQTSQVSQQPQIQDIEQGNPRKAYPAIFGGVASLMIGVIIGLCKLNSRH